MGEKPEIVSGAYLSLLNSLLPDEEGTKINLCVENIHKIWEETKEDRLTQLLFCDYSTPKKGEFNLYDDARKKLIEKGVPEEEIAYIHDAKTEKQKDDLFAKVRAGEVRILLGSTAKMGSGVNVQNKLFAISDLDCPWRPADLEQRRGRIVRQGNENPEVHIYRYVTENTFDAYLYQTVENKQYFVSQIMTSKNPLRSCEDADESALSYAEIKALCSGNPLMREKMDLDVDVAKLRFLKSEYTKNLYSMEDNIKKKLPQDIQHSESHIKNLEKDIVMVNLTKTDEFSSMKVIDRNYIGKEEKIHAGVALIEACRNAKSKNLRDGDEVGDYRGFKMSLSFNFLSKEYELILNGNDVLHIVALGESAIGNVTRIDNALTGIGQKLEDEKTKLRDMHKQIEDFKIEVTKPFPREQEIEEKSARLNELNILLNLDKRESEGDELDNSAEAGKEPTLTAEEARNEPQETEFEDIDVIAVPQEEESLVSEIPTWKQSISRTLRDKISVVSVTR